MTVKSKDYTCVVCPNGCTIKITFEEQEQGKPVFIEAQGQRCPRGITWAKQEIVDPVRSFATSVLVQNGQFLECSVRLSKPVQLTKVFEIMEEIKKLRPVAPLYIGQVLLKNPAGTDTEVIVTKNVPENIPENIPERNTSTIEKIEKTIRRIVN